MRKRVSLKSVFLPLVLLLSLAAAETRLALAEDKIVAVVNQDVITQKDLNDFLNFVRIQLSQRHKGRELEEGVRQARTDVLRRLIDDRLILQEAKKEKVEVDEARVRARLNEIKRGFPSDLQFQEDLRKQGLTRGDLEKKIREQFLMFAVIEQKVRSKINVNPDEVTAFYEGHKSAMNSGEILQVQAVSLENEDLARAVSYGLKTGKKLEELASRYPLAVNAVSINKAEGARKEIEDSVYRLGVGEVSDPVKIEDKYYVFLLLEVVPGRELSLIEAQEKIKEMLFDKKMQERLAEWLDELKNNSYIKIAQD